ncbi:MAG TPA: VOC family protein [Ktedonobacterales bacterium]|nr:VOC family protein [Ktedonobacterales bacterium]
MKFGFDHVHLIGSDLDASERFYQEMFGAETIARRDANGALNLMMRLDGINLFIRNARPTEQVNGDGKELRHTYDHFGVVVQELRAAVEELRSKGVKVLQEPSTVRPGTHVAFVEGPDHTRIEVLQRDVPVG